MTMKAVIRYACWPSQCGGFGRRVRVRFICCFSLTIPRSSLSAFVLKDFVSVFIFQILVKNSELAQNVCWEGA